MRMKQWVSLSIFMSFMAVAIVGCGGAAETTQKSTETKQQPSVAPQTPQKTVKISVAVINDYPPFEYKKDGKLVGFDVGLVEAIAKIENLQVEWVEMKFDGMIPALQTKKVDAAVAGMTIKPEREQVVDFIPYFNDGLSLVVRKDSQIQKFEDLKDKSVVAIQGSTGLTKAKELSEKYGAKVKILPDNTSLFLAVEAGNSDALIGDYAGVKYKIKLEGEQTKDRIVGDKLTAEDYGIAITKGNKDLLDKMKHGFEELKKNGEFKKLLDEYFGN